MKNIVKDKLLPSRAMKKLPSELSAVVEHFWAQYVEAAIAERVAITANDDLLAVLCRVWACSEFVAKNCVTSPAMWNELVTSGDLMIEYVATDHELQLRALTASVSDEVALAQILRRFRQREMVRIAWRDIARWSDLDRTLADLSNLARACVQVALELLQRWQAREFGVPYGAASGKPQSLVVLGMGKLGANELNFSSDIDLIFAYPEDGETRGKRFVLSNEEYFIKLGQRLITALNQQTADGFVFRVDMRLRPFGDAGPLVMSFEALETYYQLHGREWERYALIKADVIAGDRSAGNELLRALQPFVYRRYIDYGVVESLREMKRMISQQVKTKGLEGNIKLGAGGIREIEFTGQAHQLIRGGRDKGLRIRPILLVLNYLASADLLPRTVCNELAEAYVFLRQVENRLQEVADRQTHILPKDELERTRLAFAMSFRNYEAFESELRRRTLLVNSHFEQLFSVAKHKEAADSDSVFVAIWNGAAGDDAAIVILTEQGYEAAAESLHLLKGLRESSRYLSMTPKGRERIDSFMPLLLQAVATATSPSQTLTRILDLIEAVAKRSVYLALLTENPPALAQLVKLCESSSWIAKHLAQYPILLDELLHPRSLYKPLDRVALQAELKIAIDRAGDDQDRQMEEMRHFKQINVLRVAAADVSGIYPLMTVSDHLTEIAEVVVQQALDLAYRHLAAKYGRPQCIGNDGNRYEPGFLVVGYGKMGGIELGYGSDLDLVFLHGNYNNGGQTDARSSVDNLVFFARLGQRLIHILTAHTPAGSLYEVDSRLRPDGSKGLLVSSMASFAGYQETDAWTWEHQALVRARVVAGSPHLAKRFAVVRRKVLSRARDPDELRNAVRDMRLKMRESLSKAKSGMFDIKQDEGGIADIEFIVQYGVLRWAHDCAELLEWTDNFRLLEALAAAGFMTEVDARWLVKAYQSYRAAVHRLTLEDKPALVPTTEFEEYRYQVTRIWHDYMDAGIKQEQKSD